MSTLECDDSQHGQTDNLVSHPIQPPKQSILRPSSLKLRVDEKLKFSHKNFTQSIPNFFKNKTITKTGQLVATPNFPTPYVLAQFAKISYKHKKKDKRIMIITKHG